MNIRLVESKLRNFGIEKQVELVNTLPLKQRRVVGERLFNDATFVSIAEGFGANYNTTKANYRHGMMALSERIFDDTVEASTNEHQSSEAGSVQSDHQSENELRSGSESVESGKAAQEPNPTAFPAS